MGRNEPGIHVIKIICEMFQLFYDRLEVSRFYIPHMHGDMIQLILTLTYITSVD